LNYIPPGIINKIDNREPRTESRLNYFLF